MRFRTHLTLALAALAAAGCATPAPAPRDEPAPTHPTTTTTTSTEPAESAVTAKPITLPPAEPEPVTGLREIFAGVRVDIAARTVEIDGVIPIDADEADLPPIFLECVLCVTGTKDHESLISTSADASHVHAALLLIGLVPGAPGEIRWEDDRVVPVPARGDAVRITVAPADAPDADVDIASWITNARDGTILTADTSAGWVFAGSKFLERPDGDQYAADEAGPIVGLATFGIETIGFNSTFSHDTAVHQPEWIAHRGSVPPFGTRVTVRLRPGG